MTPGFSSRPQHSGGYQSQRAAVADVPAIDVGKIKFGAGRDENLFADVAQRAAQNIAQEGRGRKNKSTQLRKFYDELVMWHDKVFFEQGDTARGAKYKELAPFIKMMCAKVTYARGRDHVGENFDKLFSHVVKSIDSPETLRDAKLFMEAFLGFYKAEEK